MPYNVGIRRLGMVPTISPEYLDAIAQQAGEAAADAEDALDAANAASTTAGEALDAANAASSAASTAVDTANEASTTASTASTNASTALSTANDALDTANEALAASSALDVEVWSLDLAAQANQNLDNNLTGPTSYTVGGHTLWAQNADRATAIEVQNGTGLVMTATSGTSRSFTGPVSGNTAPFIFFELGLLATEILNGLGRDMTLWGHFAYTLPQTSNAVLFGLWAPETPYTGIVVGGGFTNASGTNSSFIQRGSTVTTFTAEDTTAHDVFAVRFPSEGQVEFYSGVYSGGWPSLGSMMLVGRDSAGYGTATSTSLLVRRNGTNPPCLVLAPCTRNSAGSPSATWKRSRITFSRR